MQLSPELKLIPSPSIFVCVDGLVARRLGQTSTFGGLLDMVTDRCSTLGLLFVLAIDYDDVHLKLVSIQRASLTISHFLEYFVS